MKVWRVGAEPRTLRCEDEVVGMMDTPELAAYLVGTIEDCERLQTARSSSQHNLDTAFAEILRLLDVQSKAFELLRKASCPDDPEWERQRRELLGLPLADPEKT
jgi:hypothetical protein